MTPGTIIAAGYPLTDSDRQSLAKRIDAEIAPLVEALKGLEWACEQLAATRPQSVYIAMIDGGQTEALLSLDARRQVARAAIAKAKQEESDVVV